MSKTLAVRISKKSLPNHLRRYHDAKQLADDAAARVKSQRDKLIAFVEENGIEDDKGHQWIEAGGFRAKRERRASSVFNEEFATAWLKANELYDECTETIVVIDEDVVLAKIYSEEIPPKIAEQMYGERETFAFKLEMI